MSGPAADDALKDAEQAIAAARVRLSMAAGRLQDQAERLFDAQRPARGVRSSGGRTDPVDLVASGIRAVGKARALISITLQKPASLLSGASALLASIWRFRQ